MHVVGWIVQSAKVSLPRNQMMIASELRWQSSGQLGIMPTSSRSILIVTAVAPMAENSSKDVANCAACDMYACDKLRGFFEVAPEARTALDTLRS